jgi:hypothetical protein
VEIEKWVESCNEYGIKAYNQDEHSRIPGRKKGNIYTTPRAFVGRRGSVILRSDPTYPF